MHEYSTLSLSRCSTLSAYRFLDRNRRTSGRSWTSPNAFERNQQAHNLFTPVPTFGSLGACTPDHALIFSVAYQISLPDFHQFQMQIFGFHRCHTLLTSHD